MQVLAPFIGSIFLSESFWVLRSLSTRNGPFLDTCLEHLIWGPNLVRFAGFSSPNHGLRTMVVATLRASSELFYSSLGDHCGGHQPLSWTLLIGPSYRVRGTVAPHHLPLLVSHPEG